MCNCRCNCRCNYGIRPFFRRGDRVRYTPWKYLARVVGFTGRGTGLVWIENLKSGRRRQVYYKNLRHS